MPPSAFLRFWALEATREAFLSQLPKSDLPAFRLCCYDFAHRTAPHQFKEITIRFRTTTFSKPAKMAALQRIGQHVRKLNFEISHSRETFLPPLIDNDGDEIYFEYDPYWQKTRHSASRLSGPVYGTWEMNDLLVKQYPPLFHAAANVPSFIQALSTLINLNHLCVSCPNQDPVQRSRRSVVDYALISLRIAVERSSLLLLDTLTLESIHPSALLYLSPVMGIGATPGSLRKWRQIKKMTIRMTSLPPPLTSNLKLLHNYLQSFAATLESLNFRWLGPKGPFPLSLPAEPCMLVSSPPLACPQQCSNPLRPLKFKNLLFMEVEHASCDATQVSSFILTHKRSISEFNFEDTTLRTGTWDEALEPLTKISGNDKWKKSAVEEMDVPLMLSPIGLEEGCMDRVMKDYFDTKVEEEPKVARTVPVVLSKEGWRREIKGRGKGFMTAQEQVRRFLRSSMLLLR